MLLPFRIEVPLLGRVTFAADGSPFELWRYSDATIAAWQPRRAQGITRADVRLSTKVLLWNEATLRPATAVRVTLKTATGEDLYTRRFLDAPAYQFDALHRWHWLAGRTRIELWLLLGFLAWQQGAVGQNDAFAWAGTALAAWPLVAVRLEGRGYFGWQRGDAPVTVATQLDLTVLPQLSAVIHVSRTFRDPPSLEVTIGFRFQVPNSAGP
jgi:hypothetical protein